MLMRLPLILLITRWGELDLTLRYGILSRTGVNFIVAKTQEHGQGL